MHGKHPAGIATLFLAEMWERFSFYGMRALLVFYMTKQFGFEDARAYAVYGLYGALVYAMPLIGGPLADRLFGHRRAAMFGATVMAFGHLAMALETDVGLYAGLALVAAGNGFFKPNMSTLVGQLYTANDPRREAGYTIFYMGINLGGALAPLGCGIIGEVYGWRYGFSLAALGMIVGLLFLWWRGHTLPASTLPSPPTSRWVLLTFGTAAIAFAMMLLFSQVTPSASGILLSVLGAGMALWLLSLILQSQPEERRGLIVIGVLMLFHTAFWASFEQAGSSLNIFADRAVNREVFGTTIPASTLQAANPVFVLALAPFFAAFWTRRQQAGRAISYPLTFGLSLLQIALAFASLVLGIWISGDGKVPLIFLLMTYFFNTTAELCISPIGMAMVSRLAPARHAGTLMGMWFLTIAVAHVLAANLAGLADSGEEGYRNVFGGISLATLALGLTCLGLTRILRLQERSA